MSELAKGKATICLVNYKTEELTRLCLRSIRKFTRYPYEVVVVDNDSGDGSLDYLRSLSWIKLIERPGEVHRSGSWAQGTALDMALAECRNEFFVAMHSDTFIHREGWLKALVEMSQDGSACVGSGKLDLKPKWEILLKKCTDLKKLLRKLGNDTKRREFYIRAICALYRTEVLHKEDLHFWMDEGMTCAQQMYYEMLKRGYKTRPVGPFQMADYIYHLAHATMVFNPEFTVRKRTEKKCKKQLEKVLHSTAVKEIINDSSLDR